MILQEMRNPHKEGLAFDLGIADEQEDLLVAIEGVDDEAQKLVDLIQEREGLILYHLNINHCLVNFSYELKVTKYRIKFTKPNEEIVFGSFNPILVTKWVELH
jgi:hypothetical protein